MRSERLRACTYLNSHKKPCFYITTLAVCGFTFSLIPCSLHCVHLLYGEPTVFSAIAQITIYTIIYNRLITDEIIPTENVSIVPNL